MRADIFNDFIRYTTFRINLLDLYGIPKEKEMLLRSIASK